MSEQPFVITINFTTPLIGRPTLDAVVAGELARWEGDEAALTSLPIKRMDGVPLASQLFVDPIALNSALTKITGFGQERQSLPLDHVEPQAGRYRRWPNLLNRYEAQAVVCGIWLGTGDTGRIQDVLADLRAIGTRRGDGLGLIADWTIEPADANPETWGLMDAARRPVRPVPLDLWRQLDGDPTAPIELVRARPFYWDHSNPAEVCAVPFTDTIVDIALSPNAGDAI